MKKRLLLIAGAVLIVLILVAAIGWWWLTATRSGALFVLGQVESRVERLEWSRAEGGLRGGLVLHDFELAQAGLAVTAERVALAARVRPAPPFDVRIDRLVLSEVAVTLPPPDPSAPSEPFQPGDYGLPVPIHVDEFVLDGLYVADADGAEVARLDRAELAGSAFAALELERFSIEAPQGVVRVSGRAGLADPWAMDLDLRLRPVIPDADLAAEIALDGPLDRLGITSTLSGDVRARLDGELRGLPDPAALAATVELAGSVERWPGLNGRIAGIELRADGALEAWTASVTAEPELDGVPVQRVAVEAEGSRDAIDDASVRVLALDGEVTADGRFAWAGEPTGSAELVLDGLDFTALYPDWPNQARLQGRTQLDLADGVLVFEELALQAPPTTLGVTGQGRYRLEDRHASVELDWTDLVWPPVLGEAEPLFSSESGHFEGRGTLEQWQAELEGWLQLPEQPRTRVELDAEGTPTEARILRGLVRPEDAGQLRLTGRATLPPSPGAELDLVVEQFDPGALVPQLPGRVDGQAHLSIADRNGELRIESLSGRLRGQPLSGSGRVAVRDAQVETASLDLALGANSARIRRPSEDAWSVDLQADRLDQLWPTLAGALTASGTIRPADRQVEWTLDSSGVIVGARRAEAIASRGVVHWGANPAATARITAENVDLNPWERLDRVELTVAGDCRGHRLNAYASGTRATFDIAAGGALADCTEPTGRWSGQVDRLVIAETPLGLWQLDRPLVLSANDGRVTAESACLWTVGHDGRLCLNGLDTGAGDGADGTAAVAFNAVPMDLLLLPLDPAFTVGSELRGLARLTWTPTGVRSIDGRLLLEPGSIRLLGTEGDLLMIDGADLALTSPNPGALRADLLLRLEGQSEIDGRLVIPDINTPADSTIDSRLALDLPRLSAFNRLVPQLDSLEGRLDAELTVTGPLLAPEFDGRMHLADGRIHHAPLGADLTGIDLTLVGDETGGRLDGQFRAGEGTGRLDGRLDVESAGWRGEVSLVGEQLGVFDADWLRMQITPDLTARFTPEELGLDGTLTIDSARLGLPPGAAERIAPSDDVVIAGVDENESTGTEAPPARAITGNVALRLGDDVRLDAAGMETRLAGGLDITWPGDRTIPTADGRIQLVDGAYRAYGQNLEVQRGDVVFTGHPIDNPVLDIAAVREIFGDPAVEFAGVEIRGPAQDPEIELFTTPPTSREKALAYVLTGAAFDHAAGQGAFNVGLWVLPNVFVSYGVGLFDSGNVLAARWDLSRRWGLRATSGESDTGADVSFIIDR